MSDPNLLQAVLAKAVLDAVPQAVRDDVFRKALEEHLFRMDDRGNSPLSETFRKSLDEAVRRLAQDVVEAPENMEKIREFMQSAFDAALDDPVFVKVLKDKLTSALNRYY